MANKTEAQWIQEANEFAENYYKENDMYPNLWAVETEFYDICHHNKELMNTMIQTCGSIKEYAKKLYSYMP